MRETWFKILPEEYAQAVVIQKNMRIYTDVCGENFYTKRKPTITFMLSNNKSFTFDVTMEIYQSVEQGTTGILKYKEYKKWSFFVDFQRHPQTETAVVIFKGLLDSNVAVGNNVYPQKMPALTFQFASGQQVTLPVPPEVYNSVFVNEHGALTYRQQGTLFYFVSFQRQQ